MTLRPKSKLTLVLIASLSLVAASKPAEAVVVYSDFSAFTNGNLVGQGGWQQFGTVSSSPIQVTGGTIGWPGGATTSNQDVTLLFPSLIPAPAVGTTTLFMAFRMSVLNSGTNPSYIAGLSILDSTSASGNFINARLAAQDNGSGTNFAFGIRVTGQAGYPFVYGTPDLEYGTVYDVIARVNMVSGTQNDTVDLFINPASANFDLLTPYATSVYTSGAGTDPTSYGGLIFSQFGSGTMNESGVSIQRALVTFDANQAFQVIPEPTAIGLLLFGLGAGAFAARRHRSANKSC